jgi:predicted NBD/HSP70 family sugar kinase
MSYVLFDIGGSKTRVAVSEDLQTIAASTQFDTQTNFLKGVRKIADEAKKLVGTNSIRAVAGGIRGVLDDKKGSIVTDPGGHLSSWADEPLVEQLKKELGAEVYLENDAALAGIGEAVYGAGVGHEIVVYHTISTGVGGAKIEDGMLDDYSHGFEPGHQILDIDHTILGEDIDPTLENLISGTAVERRMGMKPEDIPQSDAIWDQLAMYLAHGLRNSILYWSPDVIVLGGSMIVGNPRIERDAIMNHTNEALGEVVEAPIILDATLGDKGGLYGAMSLLSQKM